MENIINKLEELKKNNPENQELIDQIINEVKASEDNPKLKDSIKKNLSKLEEKINDIKDSEKIDDIKNKLTDSFKDKKGLVLIYKNDIKDFFSYIGKKSYIILIVAILFSIIGLIFYFMYPSYTTFRYAKIGVYKTGNFSDFTPNYNIVKLNLDIINDHLKTHDTIWFQKNFNMSPEEVKTIKFFSYKEDQEKESLKLTLKTSEEFTVDKFFSSLENYINSNKYLNLSFYTLKKYTDEYVKYLSERVDTLFYSYINSIKPQNPKEDKNSSFYLVQKINNSDDKSMNISDIQSIYGQLLHIKYFNDLNSKIFFYVTDASSIKKKGMSESVINYFLIGLLVGLLIVLIKYKKPEE